MNGISDASPPPSTVGDAVTIQMTAGITRVTNETSNNRAILAPQATTILEIIGRFLPEERVWVCDHCGQDIARKGIIDLVQSALLCKQCYKFMERV